MSKRVATYAAATVKFLITIAVLVAVWVAVATLAGLDKTVMPMPQSVVLAAVNHPGELLTAGRTTLVAATAGFVVGNLVGIVLACAIAASVTASRVLLPVAIGIRAIPIVAIAPLLTLAIGRGLSTVVTVAALLVFFPTLINGVLGLRSVQPQQLELMKMVNASQRQIFVRLRIPAALPRLFAAFQIGAPTAVLGVMIAEWVASGDGLGYLILQSGASFDTDLLWAAVIFATAIALLAAGITTVIGRSAISWDLDR